MNNQIVVFADWHNYCYTNTPSNINDILNEVSKDVISDMFKYGYTSSDLNYTDINGNKYEGIVSIYHGEKAKEFLK